MNQEFCSLKNILKSLKCDFINRLIAHGSCAIKYGADVNRYMNLAIEFWGRKLIAFHMIDEFANANEKDKDKLFESIGEMQKKHGDKIGECLYEKWKKLSKISE